MWQRKRKNEERGEDRVFQAVILLLILSLFGFLLFSSVKIEQKKAKLNQQLEGLKKEVQLLEEKKAKLETGISQTQKESYWEEKIREQGYKKPGENPVVVLQNKAEENSQTKLPKNLLNPLYWLEWLKEKLPSLPR